MRISSNEKQEITDICREELEEASRRINERITHFEKRPAAASEDKLEGVRNFYEDLADKNWTKADEDFLISLAEKSETEIKVMMRDGFRKARLLPIPNFAYLITVTSKEESGSEAATALSNLEAISAAERERLANVLQRELSEAARDIALTLRLSESNARMIHEQLQVMQGNIISRLSPLA